MLFRRFLCLQNIPKSNFLWSSKFIIDERKGEREVVLSNWRTKKSGRSLRIEKADLEDLEIIASQTCQGYINANSLFIKMGATMEEMLPMFRKRTRNIINQRLSLIAFDEKDRLVGMIGSEVIERVEKIKKVFGPRGQPVLEIKEDYAQEIQNGPWESLNANRYHVVCDSAIKQTNKFLPEGIQKIGILGSLFVHPEFVGEGIGVFLFCESKKLLKDLKCDSCVTFTVVESSRNVSIHPVNRMEILFTFPYSNFKENGIPIFHGLVDGTKEHSILYSDL